MCESHSVVRRDGGVWRLGASIEFASWSSEPAMSVKDGNGNVFRDECNFVVSSIA